MAQLPSLFRCQLWQVDLDATPEPRAVAALSEAEWDRARRFVFRRDRDRFVAAHAALRSALSGQTGIDAAELEFTVNAFGKPSLAGRPDVHFNLSHSQSTALIAINAHGEVGIDIEMQRTMPDADDLAASYFAPDEIRSLAGLAQAPRERAFFVCWTRKEACLKALGIGISLNLQTIDVGTGAADRSLRCSVDGTVHSLFVASIPLTGHAVGALALRGDPLLPATERKTDRDFEVSQ